jgi:hypothetical protein
MKNFDGTIKQSTRYPLIKMAIFAILAIGLINILLYSAAAGASTPQTRVIVGDTRQYMDMKV